MTNQLSDITILAAVLRSHMEEKGYSLGELARLAGISKSSLSKILSGRTSPYVHTLYQICRALGVSLAEVLAEQECVLQDAESYGITDEELEIVFFVRELSVRKRRWFEESMAMLETCETDIFLE